MADWSDGVDSIFEAIDLHQLVHDVSAQAEFRLKKYQSNSFDLDLHDSIKPRLVETNLLINIGSSEILAVLGLFWSPIEDIQSFNGPVIKRVKL